MMTHFKQNTKSVKCKNNLTYLPLSVFYTSTLKDTIKEIKSHSLGEKFVTHI